jgi:ATP-binding cassette subfamily B protein
MVIASVAEVLSIGAVLPFLAVLASPQKVLENATLQPIIQFLQIQSAQELLLPFTLFFVGATIFAGFARVALLLIQTRLSMEIGSDLSVQVYERTLYQPYSFHLSRNSSEILAGTRKAEDLVLYFIQPLLVVLSSFVILSAVVGSLLFIQPYIAFSTFFGFGLIYFALVIITKRRIHKNSHTIAALRVKVAKAIQEGLGGIRDVIMNGTQPVYSRLYKEAFIPLQLALASNQVIAGSPRFGVEALGMGLIAGLAYILAVRGGADVIPMLGALALGAQRLLPILQQIYNSYIVIKGNQANIMDALDLLEQPVQQAYTRYVEPTAFETAVTLKDISFRYTQQGPWVLRHLNLRITKGSRIGFVGSTGSGKSTLIDIVMGLLSPCEGQILIDGSPVTTQNNRAWQANISHVPQHIYLTDASILENIAFGESRDTINLQRVERAAVQAQIAKTIEGFPKGYDTLVGERGVRLSGGQRQRIGIARALYKRSNVIIFDEATSALDNQTEAAVMQTVNNLGRDITVLIIAHRLTTLKSCDQIVELASGGIKALGGYEKMTRGVSG